MARDITIRYVGDSSSAERAARNVGAANDRMARKFGGLTSSLKKFGTAAAVGLAGAAVVAVKFGTDFVKAAEESRKVMGQTNAVLQSTGGIANVTARDVAKLSEKLSFKAGIDDELIQSGANVLLTFKNVRNEVGKGNAIFDQASQAALDMSVAMGTDLTSANVQLGKALNDPIKGITALTRVGVTFTEDQKAMIKRLVETGDTLGAQKIILQELTTEFGGSAAAQATASDRLSVAWGNLQEKLGEKLLPVVERFSMWLQDKGIPLAEDFANWIGDEVVPAVKDLGRWVKDNVVPPLLTMGTTLKDTVIPALSSATSWIADKLSPAIDKLNGLLGANSDATDTNRSSWQGWLVAIAAVAAAVGVVAAAAGALIPVFKGVGVAVGLAGVAFTSLSALILGPVGAIGLAVAAVWGFRHQIVDAFQSIKDGVVRRWSENWAAVTATLSSWWATTSQWFRNLPGNIAGAIGDVKDTLTQKGRDLVSGLLGGVKGFWNESVVPWLAGFGGRVQSWFGFAKNWLLEAGKDILRGLWDGMKDIWGDVTGWLGGLGGAIKDLKGPPAKDYFILKPAGAAIMGGFFDSLKQGQGPIFKLLSRMGFTISDLFGFGGGGGTAKGLVGYARAAMGLFRNMFPGMTIGGWRAKGSVPGSDHPKGKALDLMTTSGAIASQIIGTFLGQAGAKYWIWNRQQADARRGWKVRPYTGPSPHTDHVHLSYFERGGMVPGPVGHPVAAVVHGGEGVFRPDQVRAMAPVSRGGNTITNNFYFTGPVDPSAVVGALKKYNRTNGPIDVKIR